MTLSIECKRCGHAYEVTSEDIRSGAWQRRGCPICNPATPDKEAG